MSYLHPERAAFEALVQLPDDAPVVMLNMLRFRPQAAYPDGSEHTACSGREAYRRYGELAIKHVMAVGGKRVWFGTWQLTLIGPTDDAWDEILLVEYPSRRAFTKMATDPEYLATTVHRTAALADSRLIAMRPE